MAEMRWENVVCAGLCGGAGSFGKGRQVKEVIF